MSSAKLHMLFIKVELHNGFERYMVTLLRTPKNIFPKVVHWRIIIVEYIMLKVLEKYAQIICILRINSRGDFSLQLSRRLLNF